MCGGLIDLPFIDLINPDRLLTEFCGLVAIDSAPREERAIADALIKKLEDLGFDVSEDSAGAEIGGDAGNLIAKRKGTVPGSVLLLSAHMDRVSPGKGIVPKILPGPDNTEKTGQIVSEGETILAADDIAGIAGILEAMRVIIENGFPCPPIEIAFTVAEEIGLLGARHISRESLDADMGFVLDAGGSVGTIITAAPFDTHFEAKVHGVGAHAGINPEAGLNSIIVAAKALAQIKVGRIDSETTANIGTFNSGHGTNVVPELSVITGEARSHTESKLQEQLRHMADAFRKAADDAGTTVDIRIEESYRGFRHSEDSEPVAFAAKALESIGITPKCTATGGGSDANIFNTMGIPSIALGIGFENVHSVREHIDVEQLILTAALTVAITQAAAGGIRQ